MQRFKNTLLLFLKGTAMGAADVIPGVSGGTIAFITGIYDELLRSVKSFDLKALRFLFRGDLKGLFAHINAGFVFTLFAGILLSVFTLAKLIGYLFINYPIQLNAFFFGLIIISAILILGKLKKSTFGVIFFGIIGCAVAVLITKLAPAATPSALWFIFLSGALAICAMILPGISGAFILLLLGKYEMIIESVKELNFSILAIFAGGCIVGLLSFSRLLSSLLKKYHDATVSFLAGIMVGSLSKIWPWKDFSDYENNISPGNFSTITGQDPLLGRAVLFMLIGIGIVLLPELISRRSRNLSK